MHNSSHNETLFTNPIPTAFGFKTQAEHDFSYMNSHADPPVTAARNLLENWFQRYPVDSRQDLSRRFRSARLSQHQGAFWELYLHELFRRMGFTVNTHLRLSDRSTRPDLLLLKDNVPYAVVEARLAGLPSDSEASAQRRKAELQDALNQVHSPNFFLMINGLESGPCRPSFKSLLRDLEGWLSKLNPDDPIVLSNRKQFQWSKDGWFLRLDVIPRSAEARGKPGMRSLGSTGFEVKRFDSKGEIRTALREKASKYGDLRLPYLIAINYMGTHCDHADWCDALYGSEAVHVYFGDDGTSFSRPFRKSDGFWIRNGAVQERQVSAVLGGWHISPWTIGAHRVEIYDHFSPTLTLGEEIDLPRWFLPPGKGELEMRVGHTATQLLDIPLGWPGEWPRVDR